MKVFRPTWLLMFALLLVPATDAGAPKVMSKGVLAVPHHLPAVFQPGQVQQYLSGTAEPAKLLMLGAMFVFAAILIRQRFSDASNEPSL